MLNAKSSRVYTAPIPKMPPGLIDLMEGLAKDVLKNNPTDVYVFCANHMKKLLDIRDGSSPKSVITLEQKINIANKKIRERAAKRREEYDKIMQEMSTKPNEIKTLENYNEAGQYIKNNVVRIPEEVLCGNVEHEIIAKTKEIPVSSECMNLSNVDTENKSAVIILGDNGGLQTSLKEDSNNKMTGVENCTTLNSIKNDDKNNIVKNTNEEIANDNASELKSADSEISNTNNKLNKENNINHEKECNYVEDCQHPKTTLIENQNLECEVVPNTHEDENCVNKSDSSINEDNKNYNKTNFSTVEGHKVSNNLETNADTGKSSDINATTPAIDNIPLEVSIENELNCDEKELEEHECTKNIHTTEEKELTKAKYMESQNQGNNTSMDLETAAITIQKVFRSFLFRNKTLSTDDPTSVDINSLMENKEKKSDIDVVSSMDIKDRRALGLSRIDSVLQTVNEEKSLSLSTDDSSLSSAATIIQAHVRGFLVRNKLNVNKNSSTTSGVDSDGLSLTSIDGDNDYRKNKTILNIHIVPESGHYMSRDESVLTSIDLSLDGSPPCSTNLHPLGYDRSERRKQLKREDAIQSISPPSNNSGKLSEDIDSVKEVMINENNDENLHAVQHDNSLIDVNGDLKDNVISPITDNLDALEVKSLEPIESPVKYPSERPQPLPEMALDEMDVITPFATRDEKTPNNLVNGSNLIHSGEFHEVVLPTKVSRSDTSVVRGE